MNTSDAHAAIQEQSAKCFAELKQYESNYENAVSDFVSSVQKNCLLIETKDSKLGAIRLMKFLKQLGKDQGNEQLSDRYLGAKNQTVLHWKQLLDIAGTSEELPTFTNLLVCMFPDHEPTKIGNIEQELLHKINDRLKIGNLTKNVFIMSPGGLLDEYLREIDMMDIIKIDGFDNKIPATIWGKNKAFLDRAYCGDVNAVEELLKNGVNVNVTSGQEGLTALHLAAEKGHKDVVLTLLQNGADMLQNEFEETALHIAARYGRSKEAVLAILENGADVNVKGLFGYTALHWATSHHIDTEQNSLEHGAINHTRDKSGQSPANATALSNRIEVINALLNYGADINAKTIGDDTPLHCAVQHDQFEAVKVLIEKGADVHAKNADGETALDIAVENGNETILSLLRRVT